MMQKVKPGTCENCRFRETIWEKLGSRLFQRLVCLANNFNDVAWCWTCGKYQPFIVKKKKGG